MGRPFNNKLKYNFLLEDHESFNNCCMENKLCNLALVIDIPFFMIGNACEVHIVQRVVR